MRNVIIFLTSIVLVAGLTAQKKAAVVSFYTDKIVGFTEIAQESEDYIAQVLRLSENPKFNLQPIMNKLHTEFFTKYVNVFPYNFLPEEEVILNEDYINYTPKYVLDSWESHRFLVYDGYKIIDEGSFSKDNEETVAQIFKDKAERTIYVRLYFNFVNGVGLGNTKTMKIRAWIRIGIYDEKGNKITAIREGANSRETFFLIDGIPIFDVNKILPACESAMEKLMEDIDKKLPKWKKNRLGLE